MYIFYLEPALFTGVDPVGALAGTDPGGPLHPHTSCHRKLNHSWSPNASGEDLIKKSDQSDILPPLKAVVVPGTGGAGAGAAGAGAAGGLYSMVMMVLCWCL